MRKEALHGFITLLMFVLLIASIIGVGLRLVLQPARVLELEVAGDSPVNHFGTDHRFLSIDLQSEGDASLACAVFDLSGRMVFHKDVRLDGDEGESLSLELPSSPYYNLSIDFATPPDGSVSVVLVESTLSDGVMISLAGVDFAYVLAWAAAGQSGLGGLDTGDVRQLALLIYAMVVMIFNFYLAMI